MTAPKPVNKGNLLHQQLLGELLANKQTARTEIRGKRQNGKWVETAVEVPVSRLAGNVSDLSIERAAKRWTA